MREAGAPSPGAGLMPWGLFARCSLRHWQITQTKGW